MMTSSRLKVLFVYSDRLCFCTVHRCFEIVMGLWRYQKEAVDAKAIYYEHLSECHFQAFDLIIFQRLGANQGKLSQSYKAHLERLIATYRNRCRLVYEIDDFLFKKQNGTPLWLAQLCHVALLSTEYLAAEMSAYQKNCHVIHTHVDLQSTISAKAYPLPSKDRFNIGWFTISANGLSLIQSLVEKLAKIQSPQPLIHMVCSTTFHPSIRKVIANEDILKIYPLMPQKEMYSYMKAMDCLINPLTHHAGIKRALSLDEEECEKLTLGKSEIKYALAGAFGKPLIVTPIGSYRTAITDGHNGLFASTTEEWADKLRYLVENPHRRDEIGHNAFNDVKRRYSLQSVVREYVDFFQSL